MLGMKWTGNVPVLDKECSRSTTLYNLVLDNPAGIGCVFGLGIGQPVADE